MGSLPPPPQSFPTSTSPGPLISGHKTTLNFICPSETHLASSPLLQSLVALINHTFSTSHPPYLPSTLQRLTDADPKPLLDDLAGPETFTFLLTSASPIPGTNAGLPAPTNTTSNKDDGSSTPTILATCSARPYVPHPLPPKGDKGANFARRPLVPDPEEERWELKYLVTDPALHGQGLASSLLNLCEAEVKRRFELGRLQETEARVRPVAEAGAEGKGKGDVAVSEEGVKPKKLRLLLSTIAEMNQAFYERRGWKWTAENKVPIGELGSETGFRVVFMDKLI